MVIVFVFSETLTIQICNGVRFQMPSVYNDEDSDGLYMQVES